MPGVSLWNGGFFKSTDGGVTWADAGHGFGNFDVAIFSGQGSGGVRVILGVNGYFR